MSLIKEFLDRNANKRFSVLVVGDSMIDEYYDVNVKKISPEFPIPVMHSQDSSPSCIMPGGAANVANQFKYLNADVGLLSFLNQYAVKIFEKSKFSTRESIVSEAFKLPIKRRFYCKDFPTYRWDVESDFYGLCSDTLKQQIQLLNWRIAAHYAPIIIYSDYNKGVFGEQPYLDPNKITIVDPKKNIEIWRNCTIFKPNSKEAFELSGEKNWRNQCDFFREKISCKSVAITREGSGVVGWADGYFEYEPDKIINNPKSVIGAGDCFIAHLAAAQALGFSLRESSVIAFEAGSLYIQKSYNEPVKLNSKYATIDELKNLPGKLVFTNGCFDILHTGHLSTLRFAKNKGDYLVVAVNSDKSVGEIKPGRPLNSLANRMEMLAGLEVVDFVISFDEKDPRNLIEQIRPKVLVKGGDYKAEEVVGFDVVPETYIAPLLAGQSTTNLISKL